MHIELLIVIAITLFATWFLLFRDTKKKKGGKKRTDRKA